MGASRDLTISVFVEISLVLAVTVPALIAGTTDMPGDGRRDCPGSQAWSNPGLALAAAAFAVVAIAETGRQPVDNPDTHLELTMIHEGPLLEYAGRDLALLQWAGAARHWLVLVLAAQVFLPHPSNPWLELATLPARARRALRRPGADRVGRRQGSHPGRAAADRGRRRRRAARDRDLAGGELVTRRRRALGARRPRPARRRHSPPLDRGRARHGAGARPRRRSRSTRRRSAATSSRRQRSSSGRPRSPRCSSGSRCGRGTRGRSGPRRARSCGPGSPARWR